MICKMIYLCMIYLIYLKTHLEPPHSRFGHKLRGIRLKYMVQRSSQCGTKLTRTYSSNKTVNNPNPEKNNSY